MNKLTKFSRALLAIAIMLCVALPTLAHDFEVNGIYYNYLDETAKTVAVTYKGIFFDSYSNEYTGSVTIPSSVTYSGTTYSVTSIGNSAFRDCSGLTSVTIGNSVTSIGYSAFYNCTGLTSVTIGNSVTKIGEEAFYGTGWYNNQPNGILYLDNCCLGYKGDNPTGSLSLKEGTRLICGSAFSGCDGLTSVTIPNSVTSIGSSAFRDCTGLTEVNISDLSAWCKIDFSSFDANPLYYAEKFKLNGSEIKDLVIPNDVTEIKNSAFYGCKGLTSITIPNSVTSIGSSAFRDCTGLTSVTIPNSVTSIGSSAFYGCSNLKTVINFSNLIFSKGSSGYGYIAYYACRVITDPNVSTVEDFVFSKVDNVNILGAYLGNATELILPTDFNGENYKIGDNAFADCSNLIQVTIPNSVTSIGESAFEDCSGLASVTIGNSVTSIGNYAFYNCSGLTSVTIGNSVTSIGSSAFYGCTGLTEVNISDLSAWCKIDFSDYSANPLYYATEFKLNGIEIKDLVIPNDITVIKDKTFYGCANLTSVSIPNSVTSIGDEAFNCYNLRIVKSLSNTPQQCNDNTFGSNPAALLMVPKGSMMSYMIADGWRHFTKIQEFEVDVAVKPVLTIAYPEGGVIKQKVDNGTILELQIVPSNGWKCNSVTFNGVDVTNNLDADGNYNTPSITADSQLSIVFVKDDGGVESTLANDIKVCVNGNTVTILGADEFDDVEIYNTSGINVYNGIEKSITLDSNGIYILTVEGEIFKFAM